MSTSRRSKKDIDRFVSQHGEKDIQARGYQFAVLYCEISEFDLAKKYLIGYMKGNGDKAQPHKLMGQICEGCKEYSEAIQCYKKSLELDGNQKNLLLKICQLYQSMEKMDMDTLKYWADRAGKEFPNNPAVFKLNEKILKMSRSGAGDGGQLEDLYSKQLEKNYGDVDIHVKLVELYLNSSRPNNALHHVLEVEKTLTFINSIKWYSCLVRVFQAYKKHEKLNEAQCIHYLFGLQNLVYLQIAESDVQVCSAFLHRFDQVLNEAFSVVSTKPKWLAILTEMEGQLFFLASLLLFKRAKKGQQMWKDATSLAMMCLHVSATLPALDLGASWYSKVELPDKKFIDRLHKCGCYRHSQGGHVLHSLNKLEIASKLQQLKQQLRIVPTREKLFDILFPTREMKEKKSLSFLIKTEKFSKGLLTMPSMKSITALDQEVYQMHGNSLQELVWLALQKYSARDSFQPDYGLNVFGRFPYACESTMSAGPESISQLDIIAFFMATVRCSSLSYEEQSSHQNRSRDPYCPYFLPTCLSPDLCTSEQSKWWESVHKFSTGAAKDSFSTLRAVIKQGLETVRVIGSHGMSAPLVVHLAQSFDHLSQITKDDAGRQLSLETRAALYWKEGSRLLNMMKKDLAIRYPKTRLFVDSNRTTLESRDIDRLMEEANFSLGKLAMREGNYPEAKERFEASNKPKASYYLAKIFTNLASDAKGDSEKDSNEKISLFERALEKLYATLDLIQKDKENELHTIIPADIDDVVNALDRLKMGGLSVVDSLAQDSQTDDDGDHTPSFCTPEGATGREETSPVLDNSSLQPKSLFKAESPPVLQYREDFVQSTPMAAIKPTPSPLGKSRTPAYIPHSPERMDARLWSLEKKLQVLLDIQQSSNQQFKQQEKTIKELEDNQAKFLRSQEKMQELLSDMRETLNAMRDTSRFMNIPMGLASPQAAALRAAANMAYNPAQAAWLQNTNTFGFPGNQPLIPPQARPAAYPGMGNYTGARMPGPMSVGLGAGIPQQTDLGDDDMYRIDGDYYEDEGAQENIADSQLQQEWPFGHRAGLEGRSTITYTPQGQMGYISQALKGPAIQYQYQVAQQQQQGRETSPFVLPQGVQVRPGGPVIPGAGYFSSPQPVSPNPSAGLPSTAYISAIRTSVPSTASMPPNAVAGSSLQVPPNLVQPQKSAASIQPGFFGIGSPASASTGSTGMGMANTASTNTSTATSMPLLGSLLTASKSPSVAPASAPSSTVTINSSKPGVFSFGNQPNTPVVGFGTASPASKTSPTKTPQKSPFAIKSPTTPKHGEEDVVDEYEPKVDFKPVIDLPDLVETKTGEEEEEKLFCERGKLFRYDASTSQWKERGVGEIKILRHKQSGTVRILMRRDQVLKLCANHKIQSNMKLTAMPNSDRSWCWSAMDYSEEELKMENLAIRFKNKDQADLFRTTFEEAQKSLPPSKSPAKTPEKGKGKEPSLTLKDLLSSSPPTNNTSNKTSVSTSGFGDLFKPKPGAWTCSGCYCSNTAEMLKCPACGTAMPGAQTEIKPPKASTTVKPPTTNGQPSLSEMFKPKPGSWSCPGCYCNNAGDALKCPACQTLKPGVKASDIKTSSADTATKSGFSFGAGGTTGFKFGSTSGAGTSGPTPTPFSFASLASSSTSSSIKPSAADASSSQPQTTLKTGTATATPFSFGKPADSTSKPFSFGKPAETTASPFSIPKPSSKENTSESTGQQGAQVSSTTEEKTSPFKGFSFKPTSTEGFKFTVGGPSNKEAGDASSASKPFSFTPSSSVPATQASGAVSAPSVAPSGFTFTFNKDSVIGGGTKPKDKSPAKFSLTPSSPGAKLQPSHVMSPRSPDGADGMYVNKEGEDDHIHFEPIVSMPDQVAIVTGEEDDEVLFEHRAKLYRFMPPEWKERGLGIVKVLWNKTTNKCRLLMRREQVLKICCHHYITQDLELKPMPGTDGKAWIWFAMDFAEEPAKMEQFAIRLKNAEIAANFKESFELAKEKSILATARSADASAGSGDQGLTSADDKKKDSSGDKNKDIIFIKEEKCTPEEVKKAREYQLPDHFYMYLKRPNCPGCRGCRDEIPDMNAGKSASSTPASQPEKLSSSSKSSSVSSETPKGLFTSQSTKAETTSMFGTKNDNSLGLFSASVPGSSSLFSSGGNEVSFSSLAGSSNTKAGFMQKADDSKPFSWSGAGKQLFGHTGDKDDGEEEDNVEEHDPHYEPIVPLPELVEVKTGEEDFNVLFSMRAKLFKFDSNLKQWKEKGIGEMKIMESNSEPGKFRLLMRREQVLKLACNHWLTTEMQFKPMATSETSWCWTASDFSDNEPKLEQLAVKFKTKEIADKFKAVIDNCQEQLNGNVEEKRPIQVSDTEQQRDLTEHDVLVVQHSDEKKDAEVEEETEEDDEDEDDDEDEEDDDEDESIFEKRITFFSKEGNNWKSLGTGTLVLAYDTDILGYRVTVITDTKQTVCNHMIAMESNLNLDKRTHTCEWNAQDFSTDEPVQRRFKAQFSSESAVKEFEMHFQEGKSLALESEISERHVGSLYPQEIDIPEVHAHVTGPED